MKLLASALIAFLFGAGIAFAASPVISVVPSRTSCTAPCGVFIDATGTTDADTTKPFHDLLYRHSASGITGKWVYGANTSWSKRYAEGPMAAFVFETAGTHTIESTASDGTTTVRVTNVITVTAADTTWPAAKTECISQSGVFTGCPFTVGEGATHTTSSDFDASLAACVTATDKRCLYRRGDTFTANANGTINEAGAILVGAYGSGAKPIINETGNADIINLPSSSTVDLRVVDLDVRGAGVGDTGAFVNFNSGASPTNTLILRNDVVDIGYGPVVATGGTPCTTCSWSEKTIYQENTIINYRQANGIFGPHKSSAALGNRVGYPLGNGEHGMRFQSAQKVVASFNTFEPPAATKSHLTVRALGHTTGAAADVPYDTRYFYGSSNLFNNDAATGAWIVQFAPASAEQCNWGSDILFEKNLIRMGNNGSGMLGVISEWIDVTIRNNLFHGVGRTANTTFVKVMNVQNPASLCSATSADPLDTMPAPNRNVIENNTFYTDGVFATFSPISLDGTGHTDVLNSRTFNNLAYAPNVTTTTNLPLLAGTNSGATEGNNSTDTTTSDQIKNTNPSFAIASPSIPIDFRISTGSYASSAGARRLPASIDDFFNCDDITANEHSGAFVPRARCRNYGVGGP